MHACVLLYFIYILIYFYVFTIRNVNTNPETFRYDTLSGRDKQVCAYARHMLCADDDADDGASAGLVYDRSVSMYSM